MDGGGIFKEFLEGVVKEGFDPNLGLFRATTDNRLYPNPHAQVCVWTVGWFGGVLLAVASGQRHS